MRQAVMIRPGEIRIGEVPVPEIKSNQLLLKIGYIGICGSDLHVYYGKHPFTSYPVVQGHEVSAVVERVGKAVKGFRAGEKVIVQPQVVCGTCYPCRHGEYHICDYLKVMGFQTTGMASDNFAVDADKVIKIPDDTDLETAAMIEPLAVAVHALGKAGDVRGKKVLVLGGGTIGNLVAQAAKGLGAHSVMITDLSDFRLEIAKTCGVDFCVNTGGLKDLGPTIKAAFGADGADLILECTAANAAMDQAIQHARKGSEIIVVGVFGEKPRIDLAVVQDRELRLIGTLMYKREDFVRAIELMVQKKVDLAALLSERFAFEEYKKAYEYIEKQRDKVMKVIIKVQ